MSADTHSAVSETRSDRSGTDQHLADRVAPHQFRLLDLIWAVTFAAITFAILAPILRRVSGEQVLLGVAALAIQLTSSLAVFAALAVRRRRMILRTGRRIGIGYSGEAIWKHWPIVRCYLTLIVAGLMQFGLSVAFVMKVDSLYSPIFLIYSLQLGYFFGSSFSHLHWRSYPGVIEFFERGVALDGRTLTAWKRVSVRDSKIYPDRLVLVSDATNIAGARTTHTAQVNDTLREEIFAHAAG